MTMKKILFSLCICAMFVACSSKETTNVKENSSNDSIQTVTSVVNNNQPKEKVCDNVNLERDSTLHKIEIKEMKK